MPFVHIVALKFKAEVSQTEIEDIFQGLKNLLSANLIPGLVEYTGGPYDSPEGLNKGFTHAFVMKFVDRESRDNYFPHPEHRKIVDLIVPRVDDSMCFDYEV